MCIDVDGGSFPYNVMFVFKIMVIIILTAYMLLLTLTKFTEMLIKDNA